MIGRDDKYFTRGIITRTMDTPRYRNTIILLLLHWVLFRKDTGTTNTRRRTRIINRFDNISCARVCVRNQCCKKAEGQYYYN